MRYFLEFGHGVLSRVSHGLSPEAPVALTSDSASHHAFQIGHLRGYEAALRFGILRQTDAGNVVHPFPPLNDAAAPGEELPGVSFTWHHSLLDSPFGEISVEKSVVDGRARQWGPVSSSEVDVHTTLRFEMAMAMRDGTLSLEEAVSRGAAIRGSDAALMMLAGYLRMTETLGSLRGAGASHPKYIGRTSVILSSPAYREFQLRLRGPLAMRPTAKGG